MEDDCCFISDPKNIPPKDIVWSVYRFGSPFAKGGIIGAQAIYFSKRAIEHLVRIMPNKKPMYIDPFISKNFIKPMSGKLSFEMSVPKKGYEVQHDSLISDYKDWKRFTKPNTLGQTKA